MEIINKFKSIDKAKMINKVKSIKYFDCFEVCIKIILTFIACLVATIAAMIIIGTFIKELDGVLGIEVSQWVSIVGSIIAGLSGVIGGCISARHELKSKEEKEVGHIISSIKTSLSSEVTLNEEIYARNRMVSTTLGTDENFALNQWGKLQQDVIKLQENIEYIDLATAILKLYSLLEYINKLMDIEPNTVPSSRENLYNKINDRLQVVKNQIDIYKKA